MKKIISLKVAGTAGQGVKTSGYILTKALKDLGHWTFSYSEYPSIVRGAGHSTFIITVADKKVHSVNTEVDMLVALNEESVNLHYKELKKGGVLLCDDDIEIKPAAKKHLTKKQITIIQPPVDEIVKKNNGLPVMKNSVVVGSTWALITNEYDILKKQVSKIFKKKGKDFDTNLACVKGGNDYIKNAKNTFVSLKKKSSTRIIGTGNEVAGLATYAAGCRLFCAYPMTPATGILHYLSARAEKTKMVVKQAEDEITAIQMVLGGSFAGTRSSVATSGGGLALMTETLSLIGITETPLVVFNSQRPGPATGVPTWTEQGDLDFVLKAGHGEFPRIIVAPGDVDEVFDQVINAFNLADKYQTLVIFLLDKYISGSWYQTEKFKDSQVKVQRGKIVSASELTKLKNFKRYKLTQSGISPRSLPGSKNGIYLATSDEHDEVGYSIEESEMRNAMMEKRMKKVNAIKADIPEPELIGPGNAKTTIVCWGSQKGPVIDAVDELNGKKKNVNVLHYSIVYPLKTRKLMSLAKRNKMIIVENNFSGQFANLIKAETGIDMKHRVLKYDGRPFFKDELVKILKSKI